MMVIGVVKGQAVREEHTMTLPFCPHGLRANEEADADADAGAYVETLQIIVDKPSWIDSIANGGRAYVFQQDSALSHEVLKSQDWTADNFHHHVTSHQNYCVWGGSSP
ncbi:unnamed protein product [Hymenolepis diminuta]|uniref:Uncharacterized protein n=1 Tax=Hymenolepis diminuta TaxID=6216 RepID=A0A564YAF1_HYMDI|nr:unnamed protein product [Hymenolepis diminuta]VUZ43510.1 unnamed protein product [Hymenolepis diminuta]